MQNLRQFMFHRVYQNPQAKGEEEKAEQLIETLYDYYMKNVGLLPQEYQRLLYDGEQTPRVVCDYVGAMTDRFAIAKYEEIYIPKCWHG
jgi:dGTPase